MFYHHDLPMLHFVIDNSYYLHYLPLNHDISAHTVNHIYQTSAIYIYHTTPLNQIYFHNQSISSHRGIAMLHTAENHPIYNYLYSRIFIHKHYISSEMQIKNE